MDYFYGIVEDRQDPLQVGRVRVRIHGIHTDEKTLIAAADLPWCQVILPTTSAGLSGIGTGHGLVEGSTVFGYFRDAAKQDPIILGTAAGIPQVGYKESITDELITRDVEKGFNDPRQLTVDDYKDTSEMPNPVQDSRRGWGLTTAMDTAPVNPAKIEVNYDGTGSTIEERELTKEDLPWYPLYTDSSDYSPYTRGVFTEGELKKKSSLNELILSTKLLSATSKDGDPTTAWNDMMTDAVKPQGKQYPRDEEKLWINTVAKPVYPYNKVTETESGHVFEVDDTKGAERIHLYHRSGTFHEIHPDGTESTRIVNDKWEVVAKDNKLFIAGNADITVEKGHVTINVNTGDVDMKILKGDMNTEVSEGNVNLGVTLGNVDAQIGGTLNADVIGNTTFTSPETLMTTNLTVDGTVHITGKQTNDSTITAQGDIDTKAGNAPTLATHTHNYFSGAGGAGSGAPAETKKPS
jgi:hypothetical protein